MRRASSHLVAILKHRVLIDECHAFRFRVVTQALQILGRQCLDRGVFCLANPTDFKFH